MPNPLTGDFDAILQVSGKTLDRLLGSMHQNAGTTKNIPTFPHGSFVRLGTPDVVNGVRGTARVQLAAPRIELAHGAQDRFVLSVWVRAHFIPDSGSTPFPEFIHGQVRAEYRVREEHDHRLGTLLAAYVKPDTVAFTSAGPDKSWDVAITAQVVEALRTRYAMTPHPLKADFQDRKLRALVAPDGTQAVMAAIAMSASALTGNPASVNGVILGGRDLAIAVSREYIMSLVQPTMDALLAAKLTFPVGVKVDPWIGPSFTISTVYRVTLDHATATWGTGTVPVLGVPGGRISIDIAGDAKTSSILPNASFSVKHDLWLVFDPFTQSLALYSAGPPDVDADVNGPFGGLVEGLAENSISKQFNLYINAAINNAKPKLGTMAARKATLVKQLQTIDDQADVTLDGAEFTADGVVLRGVISVVPRAWPQVKFGKLGDLTGFTAFPSWIPGGRIDDFRWRWNWFPASGGPAAPGSPAWQAQSHADRFLLRTAGSLPGLPPVPGSPEERDPSLAGVICLSLRGITIHPITGDDVPVDSDTTVFRIPPCTYFYPPKPNVGRVGIDLRRIRLFLKVWGTAAAGTGASASELAVVEVGSGSAEGTSPNTLVLHFPGEPDEETLAAVGEALAAERNPEAGLLTLLLFPEGALERGGRALAERLSAVARAASSPVLVNEDVRGGWAQALELDGVRPGPAARLVMPDGSVAWRSDGEFDGGALADVLRDALLPAPWPLPEPLVPRVSVGAPAPDFPFDLDRPDTLHLRRLQGRQLLVCFVQPWSSSSRAQAARLERISSRAAEGGAAVLAVVDGVDGRGAETWVRENAPSLLAVGDEHGGIAALFGVSAWPTMVLVSEDGTIAGVGAGTDPGAMEMMERGG